MRGSIGDKDFEYKVYKFQPFGLKIFYCMIFEDSGWFRLFGVGLKWKDRMRHNLTFSQRIGKEWYISTSKYYIGFLKKSENGK